MRKGEELSERIMVFAANVIRLTRSLPDYAAARKLNDQIVRSVMSVGANYEEARGSESLADFCHKLHVAFKEMRETRYWLCLAKKAEMVGGAEWEKAIGEATELRAILAKSLATAKGTARPATRFAPIEKYKTHNTKCKTLKPIRPF